MKNKLLITFMTLALGFFTSCKNQTVQKIKNAEPSQKDCLIGKWVYTESNFEKSFSFNADKTGAEVYSETEIRPYTWTIKDGNPTIVYNGETREWPFNLNCEKGELAVFGLTFKKRL
ncbi:MAG: hypothetical protein LLG13_08545 [Bacteroidales bacterium]|nr:hypothetical protein [Bacteroidales bacterium]